MISNVNIVGVVIFLFVGLLTLNELIPSKFKQGEHASRKLTSTREGGLDWRNLNKCALIHLGNKYGDDKFVSHTFGDLYCETMAPFRGSRVPLRMLEIGFGCGHHNHGKSALGKGRSCTSRSIQRNASARWLIDDSFAFPKSGRATSRTRTDLV